MSNWWSRNQPDPEIILTLACLLALLLLFIVAGPE